MAFLCKVNITQDRAWRAEKQGESKHTEVICPLSLEHLAPKEVDVRHPNKAWNAKGSHCTLPRVWFSSFMVPKKSCCPPFSLHEADKIQIKKGDDRDRGWGQHILTLHFNHSGTVPQTIFNKWWSDNVFYPTSYSVSVSLHINSTWSFFQNSPPCPSLKWRVTQEEIYTLGIVSCLLHNQVQKSMKIFSLSGKWCFRKL